MTKQSDNSGALHIQDVRVTDVGAVPPHYFYRTSVIEAVRAEVRADVVSRGKRVPAGCEGVYGSRAFVGRLQSAGGRFSTRHPLLTNVLLMAAIWAASFITFVILRRYF